MRYLRGIIISIVFFSAMIISSELLAQPPGHGGIPPGQGGTPPGQGGTPPGQGGGNPGNGGGPGGPGNPCPPPFRPCEPIPINGGVEYIIVAGVILGIRKLYLSKKKD